MTRITLATLMIAALSSSFAHADGARHTPAARFGTETQSPAFPGQMDEYGPAIRGAVAG